MRRSIIAVAVVVAAGFSGDVGAPAAELDVPALGPDFEFGVAQSGFQSEGHNRDSNWLRYGRQGKVGEPVGDTVDFYHRYAEDIDRAASLGVGIYRTSVEWSRVEPRRGHDDPTGWAFYDQVIRKVVDAGMRPMITLNHWVHPGWAVDLGGWNRPGMADDMVAFSKRVVDRYAWADPLWITFNEPTEYVRRELQYGGLTPQNVGRMVDGIVRATVDFPSHTPREAGCGGVVELRLLSDRRCPGLAGIGVPATDARHPRLRRRRPLLLVLRHRCVGRTRRHWGVLGEAPRRPSRSTTSSGEWRGEFPGKPVRVVENGLATDPHGNRPDGYRRADHLGDIACWPQRARQDGVDLRSYNYWSLTDNYEWGDYDSRFGLYTCFMSGVIRRSHAGRPMPSPRIATSPALGECRRGTG